MRVLGLLMLAVVVAGCGDDFATIEPKNPSTVADGLVFTRGAGSSYEIKNAVATCSASSQVPGLQVLRLIAPANAVQGSTRRAGFVVEVVPGTTGTFSFPTSVRDKFAGPSDVTVLAFDARRRNELNGSRQGSRGEITIRESTCDPEPRLSVTIDATLGSQTGLPPLKVTGGMASGPRSAS
jgi:hypothetical protein